MAGEIIQQTTNAAAIGQTNWFVVIFFAFLGVIVILIVLARKKKEDTEEEQDHYLAATKHCLQISLQNADNRYFSSWWRPHKNVSVRRIFEVLETKKIKEEPLIGNMSKYMGHYVDSLGKIMIAVCVGKKFFVFPIVELMEIPEGLVDFQDDCILVRCVGMDRKSMSTPYWPVVRNKDGTIFRYGFTLHDEFLKEKVATVALEEQGNLFKNAMSKVVQLNPKVKIGQHGRRIDKGV